MEAQPAANTRAVIEKVIISTSRTATTRTKLLGYIHRIFTFSDQNHSIEKKELTKIINDFGDLAGRAILPQGFHSPEKDNYRKDISLYPEHKELQFFTVYGLIDLYRKQKYLDFHKVEPGLIEVMNRYYPNLREWSDLYDRLETIRKALNPTAEERKAKELLEIKGKVNPEIKNAIDKIAEEFRQVIEQNEYNRLAGMAVIFQEKHPSGINLDAARRDKQPAFQELRRFMVPVVKMSSTYVLVPEHLQKIKQFTYELSVEIVASWQRKMYDKLGGFISELNKSFTVKVLGSRLRSNEILFNFNDGSRFMITNQIVSKISNLGTFFYTYPTTFHDAFLPDGSKIHNPNEYTVKDAFNKYADKIKNKETVITLAQKQAARIKALKK